MYRNILVPDCPPNIYEIGVQSKSGTRQTAVSHRKKEACMNTGNRRDRVSAFYTVNTLRTHRASLYKSILGTKVKTDFPFYDCSHHRLIQYEHRLARCVRKSINSVKRGHSIPFVSCINTGFFLCSFLCAFDNTVTLGKP